MILRREALNAALVAATADDTRFFLNAVQVDPKAHTVTATDGHVAFVITDQEPQPMGEFPLVPGANVSGELDGPICVPADILRRVIKAIPKRSTVPILSCVQIARNGSDHTAVIASTDLQVPTVATIDLNEQGQFPQVDKVIPAQDKAETVVMVLGVEVLESLCKAVKALRAGETRNAAIRFYVPTAQKDRLKQTGVIGSAIRVEANGADVTLHGAIMPMNG